MAKIGAKYIQAAKILDEPTDALPNYSQPFRFGGLSSAEMSITTASGAQYGDDVKEEEVNVFISGSLNTETTDMDHEAASNIYGAEFDKQSGEIMDDINDEPPFLGITYLKSGIRKGKNYFEGYYYPKAKVAGFGTDRAQTKTESINFQNASIPFTIFAPVTGKWRYRKAFETEAEARKWCDEKLGVTLESDD